MSTTLNVYPLFQNNQVLTSSQLNELAAYLDQQTRLSRVRLIGMGIVCGLHPSFTSLDPVDPAGIGMVSVSAGTGITSEGFLINSGECDFTQYRSYTVPADFPYAPFINPVTNAQVTLWEMLPDSFIPPAGDPNPPVPITAAFLGGADPMIVIYFIEIVDRDNNTCLGSSCNEAGRERTFTLRKLLVSTSEAQIILNTVGSSELDFPEKFDLPDLDVQRAIFDPDGPNTKNYTSFSQQYRFAVGNVYRQNFSDPLGIISVLRQTYTIFEPILKDRYSNTNPFLSIPNTAVWNEIVNGVNSVANGPGYLGIQYFYDFIKDLVLAYNEFRDAAFDMMSDCCLDMSLFPRHLLLGEAIPVDDCKPSKFRNDFVGVSISDEQRVARARFIAYFDRMVLMVRMVDLIRMHKPDPANLPLIRLTPSNEKMSKLSERAIPFIYKLDQVDPQLGINLQSVWNFELVKRCKKNPSGHFPIPAYDNQYVDQNSPRNPIETPFWFNVDKYNFYRGEGHLLWDKDLALKNYDDLRVGFNLPFNVIAVRLQGTSTRTEVLARCNFEDLRAQYTATRNKLTCRIQKLGAFIASPNSTPPGPRKLPDFIQQLIFDSEVFGHGNSSVGFLPTVFDPPGVAGPVPHTGALTYSPRTMSSAAADMTTNLSALIGRLTKTGPLIPSDLTGFNYGFDVANIDQSFIKSYMDAVLVACKVKAYLNEMLDHAWHGAINRHTQELYFTLSLWANEFFYMLNEFILDCTFRELEAIYYTLQYRINYLTDPKHDPTLFSNFVAANPGIDHKAGVAPGGTLVLVYPGTSLNFEVKTRNAIAAQLQVKKEYQVLEAKLQAETARSEEQDAMLLEVQNKLCVIYAEEATSIRPRPRPLGINVTSLVLQGIPITANQVIADFALPYLSNCDCNCLDIPAPTPDKLAIPSVIPPTFYEYNLGDYAFARDVTRSTYGCTTVTPITINLSSSLSYLGVRIGSESFVRLKFVVNGSDIPAIAGDRSAPSTIQTANGGTATIVQVNGLVQGIRYTPSSGFTGLDVITYVFEVYDNFNNVVRRSNIASLVVSVSTKCPPKAGTAVAIADTPFTPIG